MPSSITAHLIFETRSLAELGARWLVCTGWSAASGIFLSMSVLEFEDHNSTDFYGGSGNLCFHGSSLLTELLPSPFVVFPKLSLLFNTAAVSYWAGQCPKQQKLIFSLFPANPELRTLLPRKAGCRCFSNILIHSPCLHYVHTNIRLTQWVRPSSHVRKAIRPCRNHGGWYLPSLHYRLNSESSLLFLLSLWIFPQPYEAKGFLVNSELQIG